MNDTRDARSRDGCSGVNTGSDNTVPTKLAGSALVVGREAARMILGFMAFPRWLWRFVYPSAAPRLGRVESFGLRQADANRFDGIEGRRLHTGAAGEGEWGAHDRLDLHRPAEVVVLQDRRTMTGVDARGPVTLVRMVVAHHAVSRRNSQRLGMGAPRQSIDDRRGLDLHGLPRDKADGRSGQIGHQLVPDLVADVGRRRRIDAGRLQRGPQRCNAGTGPIVRLADPEDVAVRAFVGDHPP